MFLDGENLLPAASRFKHLKLGWTVVNTIMCHPDHPLQSQGAHSPSLNMLAADGSELCPSLRIALGRQTLLPSRLCFLAGRTQHPITSQLGVQKPDPLDLAWDNSQGPSSTQNSPCWSFGVTAPQFNFSLCKILLPSLPYMYYSCEDLSINPLYANLSVCIQEIWLKTTCTSISV